MIGRTSLFARNAINTLARKSHSIGGVPGEVSMVLYNYIFCFYKVSQRFKESVDHNTHNFKRVSANVVTVFLIVELAV